MAVVEASFRRVSQVRIAHVIRRLSFSDWGGTEQVVWNIAKAQKAAGHEVRIFATSALGGPDREERDGLEIVRFKPIYPWWPMPKSLKDVLDRKGGNPFVPGLGKALKSWRPDIIHSHAMARMAELVVRTAGKIGAKTAISLHGGASNVPAAEAASLRAPTKGRLPWGKALDIIFGWRRRVPEDFGGIVPVGEDEYRHWKKIHPHVLFLPNGVDTAFFSKGASEPAVKPLKTILCVARIDAQKNQMMLVEALARHRGLMLRLAGPVTSEDYRDSLARRAAELGVADRVMFLGALPPASEELLSEFRRADVFVLPSRHEPFGIVVLEAWAASLPVIASDVGGLGRLCSAHPKAAIRFIPNDAKSFDSALESMAKCLEEDGAKEFVEAGRKAAAEYDWHRLSEQLVDFYGQI